MLRELVLDKQVAEYGARTNVITRCAGAVRIGKQIISNSQGLRVHALEINGNVQKRRKGFSEHLRISI
jgi:hypothetical protein